MSAKAKKPPPPREHVPRAGRRAYLCDHRDTKGEADCHERRFMRPGEDPPECPHHGRMSRQANRAYRGQAIPDE